MAFSVSVYSLISILLIFAAAVVAVVQNAMSLGYAAELAVFALTALSLLMLGVSSAKKHELPTAFNYSESKYMKGISYFCAAGFLIDMVSCLLQIYNYFKHDKAIFGVVPLYIFCAVFAILSALAIALVGASFGDSKYDFKQFVIIAFAPLLWALLKVSQLLVGYFSIESTSDMIKLILTVVMLFFFYRFSVESVRDSNAARFTVFFAGATTACGFLFFVTRLSLAIVHRETIADFDNLLALSVLPISVFSFYFRRSIVKA